MVDRRHIAGFANLLRHVGRAGNKDGVLRAHNLSPDVLQAVYGRSAKLDTFLKRHFVLHHSEILYTCQQVKFFIE
jgi:hypothetical protein